MSASSSRDNEFLDQITELTETNLTNSQFGVSMLAKELGMSRSTLHRKVHSILKITVSQFINQVRLKHAVEMLRHTSFTISEIAYKSGFNNVSYFIKCFHEYYGYSPGKVGNRETDENASVTPARINKKRRIILIVSAISLVVLAIVLLLVFEPFTVKQNELEKAIAVLPPIVNGPDSTSYIIEGIAESVYDKLTLIQDFEKVIPWTSVKQYKNSVKGIPEIAKELQVNYIVESSGQIIDDKIRYVGRLINAIEHKTIRTYQYLKSIEDIFILEDEISALIAKAINVNITPDEQERLNKKPSENKEAYNLYLKGHYFWKKKTKEDLYLSLDYFNQAIALDSNYSLAYTGLAATYNSLPFVDHDYSWEEAYINSKSNAEKALRIDNSLSQPHANLGMIEMYYKRNWKYAKKELLKAIELDTKNADAYHFYGMYLHRTGKFDEALEYANKAIELDPNSVVYYNIRAEIYESMEKYHEALEDRKKIDEFDKDWSWWNNYRNFLNYLHLGDGAKAIMEFDKFIAILEPGGNYNEQLNQAYAKSGINGICEWFINFLYKSDSPLIKRDLAKPIFIAQIYGIMGDREHTLKLLEETYKQNKKIMLGLKYESEFKFLHNDPRFIDLLKKMGLDDV